LGGLGWGRRKITIMKKTYMIPTMKVVEIKPAQILAGSDFGKGTLDGSQAASREVRFSDWDEEE